jgi:SAM-dependent methyltransferase
MTAVSYETFTGSAPENYERYFVPAIGEPLGRDLLERAALRPGERVLDVACGTGIVTRLAAEQVGTIGSVAGLDLNPGMLAVARAVTDGLSIDWHEASVEDMPLPDGSFDVVLCQMGLQFVADKKAAATEMQRVAADGGRLVLNLPGPTPPPFTIMAEELARHVDPELAGFVHAVFSLHEPDQVTGLLEDAGLQDVVVDQRPKRLVLPPPEDFLWQYINSTPLGDTVAKADESVRIALRDSVVPRWTPFAHDGALVVEVTMLTAIARTAS